MKKTTKIILSLLTAAVVLGAFTGAAAALGESYTIYVSSSPSGADVYVEGTSYSTTAPGTITMNDGTAAGVPDRIILHFNMPGYIEETRQIMKTDFDSSNHITVPKVYLTKDSPSTGYLSVSSDPSGANVYLDGTYMGTTPIRVTTDVGGHTVRIEKSGYKTYTASNVQVYADETTSRNITLTPIQSTGYLSVTSSPKYADVYVDNSYMGQTPLTITTDVGTHSVRLQKAGYSSYSTTVRVNAGQTSSLSAVLTETVTSGYVSIASSPSGASVYIDGSYVGTTPSYSSGSISYLSAGPYTTNTSHTVTLKLTGYETYTTSFVPQEKSVTTINAVLTASQVTPTTATLTVTSSPAGASVYVDNVYYGTTPATIPNLTAGSHTVKVSALGYTDSVQTINLTAGQTVQLPVTLTPVSPTQSPGTPAPILGILAGLAAAGIFFAARRH